MSSAFAPYDHVQYSHNDHVQYLHQPHVLLAASGFISDADEDGRSKAASLVVNPRNSPGPLSTPPHSRNVSQGPEHDDQMLYEDGAGSQSNSPTSIPTPDNETFEVEMLDSDAVRNYYHDYHAHHAMASAPMQQDPVAGLDATMYFANHSHVLPDDYPGAHQYPANHALQVQPFHDMLATQPFDQLHGQHYANQPPHRDPWTSQRSQHNPNQPSSGGVIFDLETDSNDYSAYVSFDVGNWLSHNTDPNYLVSPSEPPPPPPQDAFPTTPTFITAPLAQYKHGQRSLELTVTVPSPPPAPSTNGPSTLGPRATVNYNTPLTLFTQEYAADQHYPSHSPNASTMGSSIAQLPQSPYQLFHSPRVSIPSPGASEGISSYQHSEQSDLIAMVDSYMSDASDTKSLLPASPARLDASPAIDASPEPEAESRSRSHVTRKGPGRPGGRALGTHLEFRVAKAAHDMRRTGACWHCVLQRDKCGPGETCERCLKRSQRPNADCGLGCSRVKLIELAKDFLPTLVTQMHEDAHLTRFVTKHIHQWNNVEITIHMTCGQTGMPRLPVKVYEFVPNDDELLFQFQYVTDPATQQRVAVRKTSPALGMVHINHGEEKKYDKYVSDIVDNHIDAFGDLCWKEDDNDFQQKLFYLLTRVRPKSDDEAKLLREVFRYIVVTFIMSHVLTIAEEDKHRTLSKMHSYAGPASYVQNFTSPRMANRQLKYFFARIQRTILSTVLNKLQQIFKSSKGCDKWLAAFVAVTGICMAHEDQQKTLHQVMQTKAATEDLDNRDCQARADVACSEIDGRMNFIQQLFRWKYNRKCNPLRDAEHAWDTEVGFGDESSVTFVRSVAQLVKENSKFLDRVRLET